MPLLTIVFTDVVESSATKRDVSLGRDSRERDHAYLEKVQTRHFDLVRASCRAHGGNEVSTMGDAFYLTFEDPVQAVRCSVDIQRRLAADPIDTPRGPLRLRIGVHSGFPEFFEGSWHGTDVDTAARVQAAATERQILLSSRTYELVRQMTDVRFHPRGDFALKGVDRIALWEADWDGKGPRPTAAPPLGEIERKRNVKRMAIVAAAVTVLAVAAGYLIHRLLPPKHPPPFVYSETPRKSVAVLAFKNDGAPAEDWMENALPDMLNSELAASTGLRLISGEDVFHATSDLRVPRMASYAKPTLEKLHAILRSDYVLAGSFVASGNSKSDSIRLDVRLQDSSSGDFVSAFPVEGTVGDMHGLLNQVASAIRSKLQISNPNDAEIAQSKAALSENPEATRLYSEGLARLRNFDALNAQDPLQRAVALDPNWALPHAALSDAWKLRGYDSNAKEEAEKALNLSSNLSDVDKRALEGRYRELNSEWEQAIKIYGDLWGVFKDDPDYALDLARVQTSAGKGTDALATLDSLEKMPGMSGDPRIDFARSYAAESLSDIKLQQSSAAAAAEKAAALGSRYLAAQAFWRECEALYALGDLDNAMAACRQSQDSAPFESVIDARTKTVEANIMLQRGDATAALEMRRQALDIARKLGSQVDVIGALDNLGNLVYMQGDSKTAGSYLNEAMHTAEAIDNKQQLLDVQNDYAGDLYGAGDFTGAEALYRKSLATAEEIHDQRGTALALQNLGLVLMLQGNLARAKPQIEQAIAIQRSAGLQADLAGSLNELGDLLLAQNDLEGARKSYEESLKISTDIQSPAGIASTRASLAELALANGKPADAEALARQAVETFQDQKLLDQQAAALNTLANVYLAGDKLSDAQSAVDSALKLNPQDRATQLSLRITAALAKARSGNPTEASKDLDGTLAQARKMGMEGTSLDAAFAKAKIMEESNPESARLLFQSLEREAASRGYLRIAADASRSRKESTQAPLGASTAPH